MGDKIGVSKMKMDSCKGEFRRRGIVDETVETVGEVGFEMKSPTS